MSQSWVEAFLASKIAKSASQRSPCTAGNETAPAAAAQAGLRRAELIRRAEVG